MKTLVLISGGLDSYVLADLARKNSDEVYALTFDYGQNNNKEIECSKEIAKGIGVKEHFIIKIDFGSWQKKYMNNVLLSDNSEGNTAYVPARNLIFLSYAVGIAESLNIKNIAIGVAISDFSLDEDRRGGFSDCKPQFMKDFQKVAQDIVGSDIKIYAPLINSTKDKIIEYGITNNLNLEKTWSCYRNGSKPCGKCEACKIRIYGFYKNGIKDGLEYENDFVEIAKEVEKDWVINQ